MYEVAITRTSGEYVTDRKEAKEALTAVFGKTPRITDQGWTDEGMWGVQIPRGTQDGEHASPDGRYIVSIDRDCY